MEEKKDKKFILYIIIGVLIITVALLIIILINNNINYRNDKDVTKNNEVSNSTDDGSKDIVEEDKNTEEIKDNVNSVSSDDSSNSEDDTIEYFSNIDKNIDTSDSNSIKSYFIKTVDFIFYGEKINGYTFAELSDIAKIKVISVALKLDNKIESTFPGYKESISTSSKKIYTNLKEKLVTMYLDISSDICDKHADGCTTAKDIFQDIKKSCGIGWSFIKSILSDGTDKLKKWYEVYRGK